MEHHEVEKILGRNDVVFKVSHTGWEQGLPMGDGSFGGLAFHENSKLAWIINHLDVIQSRYRYTTTSMRDMETAIKVMEIPFRQRQNNTANASGTELERRRAELARRAPAYYPERGLAKGFTMHPIAARFHLWFEDNGRIREPLAQRLHLYDGVVSSRYEKVVVTSFVARQYRTLVIRMEGLEKRDVCHFRMTTDYIRFDKNRPEFYHDNNLLWSDYTLECNSFRFTTMVSVLGGKARLELSDSGIAGAVEQTTPCPVTFLVTVATKHDASNTVARAKSVLSCAAKAGHAEIFRHHRKYWNGFWQKSFIAVEDKFLENLWYCNLYALACTCGAGQKKPNEKDGCGLHGLFMGEDVAPWANGWFCDVNIEQAYWPFFTTNHVDCVMPFIDEVRNRWRLGKVRAKEIFHMRGANMDAGKYMCIGPWYCQFLWWYYLYTGDVSFLKAKAYPVMRDVGLFFLDYLRKDSDGRYYIYPTYSPEQGSDNVRNATIDLAVLKYLFKVLVKCCDVLNVDPKEQKAWRDVWVHLSDYPLGRANGKLVIKDSESRPASAVIRHPSLLMPIYPLKEAETIGARKPSTVAKNTVRNVAKGIELVSFSQTWVAAAMASLGLGDEALDYLYRKFISFHLRSNGLFSDSTPFFKQRLDIQLGAKVNKSAPPYLDSAGSFVSAVNEMFLSGFDAGKICVFEGIPGKWNKAKFSGFLAPHGFVVSAERNKGRTLYVQLESTQGNKCYLRNPFGKGKARVMDLDSGKQVLLTRRSEFCFPTARGHRYGIVRPGEAESPSENVTGNGNGSCPFPPCYRTEWEYSVCVGGDKESDARARYEKVVSGFFLEKLCVFSFGQEVPGHVRIDKDAVYGKYGDFGWQAGSPDTFLVRLPAGRYRVVELGTDHDVREKTMDVRDIAPVRLKVRSGKTFCLGITRPTQWMILGPIREGTGGFLPKDVNLEQGNLGRRWRRVVLDESPYRGINLGDAERGSNYYLVSDVFAEKKGKALVMTMWNSSLSLCWWHNGRRIFDVPASAPGENRRELLDVELQLRKGWNRLFVRMESRMDQHVEYIARVTDRMTIRDTAYGHKPSDDTIERN